VARAYRWSLRRLRTDRIDPYLRHWRGPGPLEETVEAFESPVRGHPLLGVSNLDVDDLADLPPGAEESPPGPRIGGRPPADCVCAWGDAR
jgi:diketogulonate reductase-like aldo/keto reductase